MEPVRGARRAAADLARRCASTASARRSAGRRRGSTSTATRSAPGWRADRALARAGAPRLRSAAMRREFDEQAEPAGEPAAERAPELPDGAPGPVASRGSVTPADVVALQRSAGNASVARLVAGRAPGAALQRTWLNPFHTAPVDDDSLTDEQKIEQTARSSGNDVVQMYSEPPGAVRPGHRGAADRDAEPAQRRGLGRPVAESAMEAIWNSFGDRVAEVAAAIRTCGAHASTAGRSCTDRAPCSDAARGLRARREGDRRPPHGREPGRGAAGDGGARAARAAGGQASPTRDLEVRLRRAGGRHPDGASAARPRRPRPRCAGCPSATAASGTATPRTGARRRPRGRGCGRWRSPTPRGT